MANIFNTKITLADEDASDMPRTEELLQHTSWRLLQNRGQYTIPILSTPGDGYEIFRFTQPYSNWFNACAVRAGKAGGCWRVDIFQWIWPPMLVLIKMVWEVVRRWRNTLPQVQWRSVIQSSTVTYTLAWRIVRHSSHKLWMRKK